MKNTLYICKSFHGLSYTADYEGMDARDIAPNGTIEEAVKESLELFNLKESDVKIEIDL